MKTKWTIMKFHNIYNNNNNNRHKKVYKLLDYKQRGWKHNLLLQCLDHQNYKHQLIDQDLQKDTHLNLGWGVDQYKSWDLLNKDPNPTKQTDTPKFVDKVVVELMQVDI